MIQSFNAISVALDFGDDPISVGRLAVRDRKIYFEYDRDFLHSGLNISPLRMPLKPGLQTFDPFLFEGLPGVFNDSLPDGWGRLLFDRYMRSLGVQPAQLTPLDRLASVGVNGLGALTYKPSLDLDEAGQSVSLEVLAAQVNVILQGDSSALLQELVALNGSSAGARPKALIGVSTNKEHLIHGVSDLPSDYSAWIVKFANSIDSRDAGAIEYVYSLLAKAAGIDMPATHLFCNDRHGKYFAIRRFDRVGSKRVHMHSACGLLHSDFRTPSLDYEDLLLLTGTLTRDVREVEKMFRVAVFNVLAHNRDDHAKNFTFLMDAQGRWVLSPAYDLTFSTGPNGEQSTTVMGEGRHPSTEDLLKLAKAADINISVARAVIDQVKESLGHWQVLAKEHDVSAVSIKCIAKHLVKSLR